MDIKNQKLPLEVEEQKELLQKIRELQVKEKKLERKIKYLEHDREYINVMYESEVRLRDFNEREKEQQYMYNRLLLDNCPSILVVFNKELRYVIGTGKLLCDIFGFCDVLELNDLSIQDLFGRNVPGAWLEKAVNGCQKVIESQCVVNYNEQLNFTSGRKMNVDINISPVFDKDKALQGVLFLMHDITELLFTKEKAEAASRAKSYFLTSISHEIRTPMNAIRGMGNLLNVTEMTDVQESYVKNILTASDSLLQIINDILDFSKIDANELELVLQRYYTADIIYDIANMISLKASEKGLRFVLDISPTLPRALLGDVVRIKQMLTNILDNAVKYTKEGYVKLSIYYEKKEENMLTLFCVVEDTGIGIKSGDIDSLFEAFGYVDAKKYHDIKGIGLGLTISKNLAIAMGGDIDVKTEYQKGSIFTLKIPQEIFDITPLVKIENPDKKRVLLIGDNLASDCVEKMLNELFLSYDYIKDTRKISACLEKNSYTHIIYWYNMAEDAIRENSIILNNVSLAAVKDLAIVSLQDTTSGVKTLFEPVLVTKLAEVLNEEVPVSADENSIGIFKTIDCRVLLVDDNEINLLVAEELLKHYDIAVDTAQSGQEALLLASSNNYDMIFMDHMMPEVDGIETTAMLRKLNPWNAKVPIIALTANAVMGIKKFFIENQLDDYLSKPIDIKELNGILKKWLPVEKISLQDIVVVNVETPEAAGDNDFMKQLQACGLDVNSSITLLGGNVATYKSLVEIFISRAHRNKMKLLELFNSKDWHEFRVMVHGYKSSFYNIGAKALSEEARKLEVAAIKENYNYIKSYFSEFIVNMEKLEKQLSQLFITNQLTEDKPKATDENRALLAGKLDEIETFIESLENETADDLLQELVEVSYGKEVDILLSEIKNALRSFDYDTVSELVVKIKGNLQSA